MKPVRIIPKNYRNVTGLLASSKNNAMAAFESSLERDFYTILEFDYNVDCFVEQPVRIDFSDKKGKSRHYTPDVFVKYRRDIVPALHMKHMLCEIKYREDLKKKWADYKPKFKAARRYAKNKGWEFRILTEREIRIPFLQNAKFLLPYRKISVDWHFVKLLKEAIYEIREADPQTLLLAVFADKWKQAELLPSLWFMISEKRIGTDLTLPLTMKSRIWTVDVPYYLGGV